MIPTRWPSYTLVILTALLGWVVPLGLPLVWRLLGAPPRRENLSEKPLPTGTTVGAPISARFHLAALLFLGFLGIFILTLPLLFTLHKDEGVLPSLLVTGVVLAMLIALFYCLRRGDLSWNSPRGRDESIEGSQIE